MDLHIYRNSQDRWQHLRADARTYGAVLAINALTLDELAERITPDVKTASPGQRLVVVQQAVKEISDFGCQISELGDPREHASPKSEVRHPKSDIASPFLARYAYEAIVELKGAQVRPSELRSAGVELLTGILEKYEAGLRRCALVDPQDRRVLAASRVKERAVTWLRRFERVVLHALYDVTEAEFMLIRSLIEALPDGGAVVLFNTTTNVKPTQFAEWTWQRFVRDEALADKTFPEFCRASQPGRPVLERLFVFQPADPLPPDDSLKIVETPARYKEVERIGADISDLLLGGENPNQIAVVVRHIENYGEMMDDVFSRYRIPHTFETGTPLLRIPFIKFWLALLDLVTSDRPRHALARVMSSAYFEPRLSPRIDVERALAGVGYIDRRHLRASALAARSNSPLAAELQGFETWLDDLEKSRNTIAGFLGREFGDGDRIPAVTRAEAGLGQEFGLRPRIPMTERDRHAWRSLVDELEMVNSIAGAISFPEFRKIISEITALRTVDRWTSAITPPGLPAVRIMGPQSLGHREYRWIFAPGFADGEFPARASANPLLPDETVEAINRVIRPRHVMAARDRSRREPLYLFLLLDSATKRVTLTYPAATLEGETVYPSVYIREIARHYAESPIESARGALARHALPRAEGEWLSAIAEEWRKGSLSDARAAELLGEDIVARAHLERRGVDRSRIGSAALPVDRVWHPSELNALSTCPFIFLSKYSLKLRASEAPDFEVPVSELGILAHNVLRDFYAQPVPASVEAAKNRMDAIIARRLSQADISGKGPYSVFEPSLWKIRRRQLVSVLNEYVNFAVRDALDGFQTLPEYLDAPLPPAQLGSATLAGRPDHVAAHRCSDGRIDAIRIDDFKYSAASSSTTKQLQESFQIPVYAYLAVQAIRERPRIEGRYLLLRSPSRAVVSAAIDETVFADVGNRIDSLLQKVRAGQFQPDPADRQECPDCDYRRLCRFYGS